jgi:hypothetical protein
VVICYRVINLLTLLLGDKSVIEHDLDIETSDGLMNTFITHPEEGGPFPVVLLLMDAIGKREEILYG